MRRSESVEVEMNTVPKNSGKKIIIAVDDNPAFADVLRVYLEEQNLYELLHFTSSRSALDFLRKFPEDIVGIVSDIMMTDLDGFDFLDMVRESPVCASLPVIFISGIDFNVFRDFFREREFTAFLPKPLGYDEFIRAVIEHFGAEENDPFSSAA